MDVYEVGTLDANFLRYGLHNALQKCPLVANRENWNVARINEKLSAPATRLQGLAVLEAFLPQCPDDLFGEHAVSWMQQCLHTLEAHGRGAAVPLAFHVLEMLLQMSSHFSELTKVISSTVVSKALEKIVISLDADSAPALKCLRVLMTHYGGACGVSKSLLEQALLRSVANPQRAARAAGCWALLAAVGGAGGQRANHKQRWADLQLRLCNTLHHLLGRLLRRYRVLHSWTETDDILPLPEVNEANPVASSQQLTKQLCSVAKFLQAMLRGVFPAVKSVSAGEIMEVVCRGLAVNCFTPPSRDADRDVVVATCLPDIHVAMLGVLEALIACCGRNLIPFCGVICELALQELKWTATESSHYASERPFGPVRIAACRALTAWCGVSKAASLVEKYAEQLVVVLLPDVQSSKPGISLSVPASKGKDSSKEAPKADRPGGSPSRRSKLRDSRANSEVCAAALELLCAMLSSAAPFVPAKLHKVLQEAAATLVLDIQRSGEPGELPVPYSVPGCRLGLYRLLETLAMWPHGERAPPTHFALVAFSRGQADNDSQVSSFCTTALCHMEKIAHPAFASLQFPVAARSEGPTKEWRSEMPASRLGLQSSQVDVSSFTEDKGNTISTDRVEPGLDITEVSSSEDNVEEIAVEAVSQESDSDDVDDDDDGLRITSEVLPKTKQIALDSSSSSSTPVLVDIDEHSMSQDEDGSVNVEDVVVLSDESSDGIEGWTVVEKAKSKKMNLKEKAMQKAVSNKEVANTATAVRQGNLTESLCLSSFKEHEGETDHCWTAEEAALVSDIVKDFESEVDKTIDSHNSSEAMSEDEGETEERVDVPVAAIAASKFEASQSNRAGEWVANKKNPQKRDASPLPSSAPKNKKQRTDRHQLRENKNVQGIDSDVEEVAQVASKEMGEEDETAKVKNKHAKLKMSTSEDQHVESLEQPKKVVSASEQLEEVKDQEIHSSQMNTENVNIEHIKSQESMHTEEKLDPVKQCSAPLDTSRESVEQVEVRVDGETEKDSDSVRNHPALSETSEQDCVLVVPGQGSPEQMETCDGDSEQVTELERERTGKGSDLVQTCLTEVETSDKNTDQVKALEDEGNEDGNDSEQMSSTPMKPVEIQEPEGPENEDGLVQAQPAQVETCEDNRCQVIGQGLVGSPECHSPEVQLVKQATHVNTNDREISLCEGNEENSKIPEEQRNGHPAVQLPQTVEESASEKN
ncbi:proline-, glutamic acid- and leucine-rich protein 1-like [Bacillus rossius redtenbacheri]|uniref:proline-, glutamic acid- and leucine-rich protein 1-like n=1 Tax=Bacillus rossius redtenbacheri TaxID=93214 RepID=UPI002FDCB289